MGHSAKQSQSVVLTPETIIEARRGMQSVTKKWTALAWEYIGANNPELARVRSDLELRGWSEWEGFTLTILPEVA